MFSTMPRIGTFNCLNMSIPLRASSSATSCGVDTITAPSTTAFCASVICTSPVPGGRSTISTSSAPHCTCIIICCNAPINIGPRHTTAWSSLVINPIDISVTPWFLSGKIVFPSGDAGLPETPIIRGCDGP